MVGNRNTPAFRRLTRIKQRGNYAPDDLPGFQNTLVSNLDQIESAEKQKSEVSVEELEIINPYDEDILNTVSEESLEQTQFEHDYSGDELEIDGGEPLQLINAHLTVSLPNASLIHRDFGFYSKRFLKFIAEIIDDYPRLFSSIFLGLILLSIFWIFCFWLRNYIMGWIFWFVEVIWPLLHVLLRSAESMCHSSGYFFEHIDDVGQSFFCDLAEIWCFHYNQMCASRCTFTELALERMRKR